MKKFCQFICLSDPNLLPEVNDRKKKLHTINSTEIAFTRKAVKPNDIMPTKLLEFYRDLRQIDPSLDPSNLSEELPF